MNYKSSDGLVHYPRGWVGDLRTYYPSFGYFPCNEKQGRGEVYMRVEAPVTCLACLAAYEGDS